MVADAAPDELASVLEATLENLRRTPGLEAAAIIGRDGILHAHNLPPDADPKVVGAITAALVGTATQTAEVLGKGPFVQCMVTTAGGRIVAVEAGPDHLLAAMLESEANLGLILMALDRAAEDAGRVLRERTP